MSGRISPPSERLDASGFRFAIVAARFHDAITSKLVEGALSCLEERGASDVTIDWVPGSFELALAARARAEAGCDGVIALGCIIRGDTPHFDFVAAESARGIMTAMLQTSVPIAFGVLTTDDVEQAEARAGGSEGNKGWDAALGTIEMATVLSRSRRNSS